MNIGAKRSARVAATPHHVTLRYILDSLNKQPPSMRLDQVTDNNELIITCLDAPKDAPAVYRVNLNQGLQPADIDAAAMRVIPDSARKKPDWWPNQLHFGMLLDQRFPVECKLTAEQYEPVKVLGVRDSKTGEITPIITDMDLLWVSEPGEDDPMVKECRTLGIPLFEVMNCFNQKDRRCMLDMLKYIAATDRKLYRNQPEFQDNLKLSGETDEALSRMGCVTPFMAYFILLANQRFSNFVGHIGDLMQHSAEIFNPYEPSALGATLNITGGMIIETFCQDDQILLAKELVEQSHHLRIHPNWDMNKWGVIVEKMLERGDNISPDVKQAYDNYLYQKDLESSSPIPPLIRKFSRNISETAFSLFGKSSSDEHVTPMRKDSTGPFLVQARCKEININDEKSSLLGKPKIERVKAFCMNAAQLAENEIWKQIDSNTVELSIRDQSSEPQAYTFKIEAIKISLIAGKVDQTSIGALKKLSDILFDGKKVEIIAASPEIKKITDSVFSPSISPRPN